MIYLQKFRDHFHSTMKAFHQSTQHNTTPAPRGQVSITATAKELVDRFNTTMAEGIGKLDAAMAEVRAELDEHQAAKDVMLASRDRIALLETWVCALIEDRSNPTPLAPLVANQDMEAPEEPNYNDDFEV